MPAGVVSSSTPPLAVCSMLQGWGQAESSGGQERGNRLRCEMAKDRAWRGLLSVRLKRRAVFVMRRDLRSEALGADAVRARHEWLKRQRMDRGAS
jgi:hypothetical protein